MTTDARAEIAALKAATATNGSGPSDEIGEVSIVPIEEFTAVDEPGAEAVVGTEADALIAQNSDNMVYGDGGAGKTTLTIDLAYHLASARTWLGFAIDAPHRVLMIEAEGPRAMFRKKLKRKLDAWGAVEGRIQILETPWAQFTFATQEWREQLARDIRDLDIEVLICGPLNKIGMDLAGTLAEVNAFMRYVKELRLALDGRSLVVILVHHENKGGAVSGSWEGQGDTLLHVSKAGNGKTLLSVQKARWASEAHNTTLNLLWTDGEGFEIEDQKDAFTLMVELDQTWRTQHEIRVAIGVGMAKVAEALDDHQDAFEHITGDAAKTEKRSPNAHLYRPNLGLN